MALQKADARVNEERVIITVVENAQLNTTTGEKTASIPCDL